MTSADETSASLPSLAKVIQLARAENASTVDLLGVVVDVTTSRAPLFPIHVLWLRDYSLAGNERVAVSLRGQHALCKAEVSDLVKMNQVKLVSVESYSEKTVYHFSIKAMDPESAWFVVGKIQSNGAFQKHAYSSAAVSPYPVMLSPSRMQNLVDWYNNQFHVSPSLSPPRAGLKSLSQLQATVGVVSHTMAYVLDVQNHMDSSRNRKRRRSDNKTCVYAMLSDSTKDTTTIAFADLQNRWKHALLTAQSTRQLVYFQDVETRRHDHDEIILVSTNNTRVTLLTAAAARDDKNPHSQEDADIQSQFMLSLTQRGNSQLTNTEDDEDQHPASRTFVATIQSLCIQMHVSNEPLILDDKVSKENLRLRCARLVEIANLALSQNGDIPPGNITLNINNDSTGRNQTQSVSFQSNSSILPRLLGCSTTSAENGSYILADELSACSILKAILTQKVPLIWTLEEADSNSTEDSEQELIATNVEYRNRL
jgi:hypothetical protein